MPILEGSAGCLLDAATPRLVSKYAIVLRGDRRQYMGSRRDDLGGVRERGARIFPNPCIPQRESTKRSSTRRSRGRSRWAESRSSSSQATTGAVVDEFMPCLKAVKPVLQVDPLYHGTADRARVPPEDERACQRVFDLSIRRHFDLRAGGDPPLAGLVGDELHRRDRGQRKEDGRQSAGRGRVADVARDHRG